MKTRKWDDDPAKKLEALCVFFPEVIQNRWKERLICSAERIAAYEGSETVSEDIFWRAVYEVFPGGYEPLILRTKDPDALKADMRSSRTQEDISPGAEPVQLKRWAGPADVTAPVPSGKRILAVSSSARKGGNTDVVIDELLNACEKGGSLVEKIYLSDLTLKPCTGCRACRRGDVKTICTVRDDMTTLMYDKLYQMDGLILGFPIYTARENGIMANFMDRWDCLANPELTRKMPPGKKALVVSSWMWPNISAYDNVVEQMVILLRLHGITATEVLTVSGTRGRKHGRGVINNHPDLLKTANQAGIDFLKRL